jgi:glycosyltransferase involved in cell wall biosynthesis
VEVIHGSGDHMRAVVADAEILTRLGVQEQHYFVAVGSANPAKNFSALLSAFAGLPARFGGRLVIVGGANESVFAADDRPADNARIVRAGSLSDAELKALYESALGLVFPSLYEGFGLPPIEAMVCGCPVAASNAASIPEACGDAALYFDPRAPAAIGAAMMRLHDEPELRRQLRERGERRAATLNWAATARVLMESLAPSEPAS